MGITVRGTSPMSSPYTPGIPRSGAKAAIVVRTPKAAGKSTLRVPRIADSSRLSPPSSIRRWTFSPTTIASSTTMPRATMNANMLSRLTVIPRPGINRNAPKNVNGSPAAVQTARRVESVKNSTRKMSPRPDSPFRTMRSRRPWKSSDAKYQGVTRIPSGTRTAAMTSRALTVVSASRPPSRSRTLRNTAGSPFIEASRSDAAKPSATVAMSARRTTPPSGAVMTGIRRNSPAVVAAPSVRRLSS